MTTARHGAVHRKMIGETIEDRSARTESRQGIPRTGTNGGEAQGTTAAIAIGTENAKGIESGTDRSVHRSGTVSRGNGRAGSMGGNREIQEMQEIRETRERQEIRGMGERQEIRGSQESRGSRESRESRDVTMIGVEDGMRKRTGGDIRTRETMTMSGHQNEDDKGLQSSSFISPSPYQSQPSPPPPHLPVLLAPLLSLRSPKKIMTAKGWSPGRQSLICAGTSAHVSAASSVPLGRWR